MHIGIVTQAYYPVLGGVTEHVWNVARELERRGERVTVVTGRSDTPAVDDRGLRVVRHGRQLPIVSNGASVRLTWAWGLGDWLRELERAERFDVVHVHSPLDPVLPLVASRGMRTPKVGTHHSARDTRSPVDAIPVIFRPYFAESAARIQRHVAVSPGAEDWVRRYLPQVECTIVPNGVDVERFSPRVPPIPEYRDGVFTILYVGRMDPRKGAKYLFLALPHLEERLRDYRLVVVGSGWLRRWYDTHIPPALRRRVVFAGRASFEDMPRYFRSADVFCSPAVGNESFGIVLLEAMASGTPVVASDIAGYRDVVERGTSGLLVPPRDPRALAEAIHAIAADPARARRLAAAGLARARGFAWPGVVERLLPIYQSVRDGARASSGSPSSSALMTG
ncbi:MAG TPA: glycosyltransferase family 4 protein [Candidatus Eisenbacteria bacterium]